MKLESIDVDVAINNKLASSDPNRKKEGRKKSDKPSGGQTDHVGTTLTKQSGILPFQWFINHATLFRRCALVSDEAAHNGNKRANYTVHASHTSTYQSSNTSNKCKTSIGIEEYKNQLYTHAISRAVLRV